MIVAVLANEILKNELLSKNAAADVEWVWVDSLRSLTMLEADLYMDLLFELDSERTARLKQVLPRPVLVNAVAHTTRTIGGNFIRIHAWPTFLQRPLAELALPAGVDESVIAGIFKKIGWQYRIVPDVPGMITARILAMIVNEAYFTWGMGVSSREEIDTAMKLGTNYPLGPFEWSEKIGLKNIYELLKELARTDPRYTIAPALTAAIHEQVSNP
ncbi:MAG TPA: 3-hydroxyacyl-CoA dehydrogenase family protein [Chitinophagaceae bacterium]|nr:3-hydroxyacyl-CoA dehydrogenase family protein [Chitinophagaceae bacterium]